MPLKKRCLHFLFAIVHSIAGLTIGCCLLAVVAFTLHLLPPSFSDEQIIALLVGITTGVLASPVLQVYERYSTSCQVYSNILNDIKLLRDCIDKYSIYSKAFTYRLIIKSLYNTICRESIKLTYKRDYRIIASVLFPLVNSVLTAQDNQSILKAKEALDRQLKTF